MPVFGQCTHQIFASGHYRNRFGDFFYFFLGFEDLTYSLDSADDEHPINHLVPKKLSWIGGPEPI